MEELKVKFQVGSQGSRGRVLDGSFFALFGDLVDAVECVSDVKLEL
jgi:hypothetical protein